MFRFYSTNRKHSATNLHNNMKKLWEENSETVVQLINNSVAQSNSAQQWGTKLSQNQQTIANGIIKFCGEKERVSNLFNHLIQYIHGAIDVFMWKKNVVDFRKRWFEKADEICNLLNILGEWNIRSYFYNQIFLIESLIKAFMKRDVEAVKYYRKELLNNNINLSVTLTNGIIKANSILFW